MTALQSISPGDLHARVRAFLVGEFARKDQNKCVKIELLRGKGTMFSDSIRTWERAEHPELYATATKWPEFSNEVISIAEGEVAGAGKHRFTLRATQHHGTRNTCTILIQTESESSGSSDDAGDDLMSPTERGQTALMMRAFGDVVRVNKDMAGQGTQIMGSIAKTLAEELSDLRRENNELRQENNKLRAEDYEKGFAVYERQKQIEESSRKFQQFFGLAKSALDTLMVPKIGADGNSQLVVLLRQFFDSLTEDQQQVIAGVITPDQQQMLMTLYRAVAAASNTSPSSSAPSDSANGTH